MKKVLLLLILANICTYGMMAILHSMNVEFKSMHFILLNLSFGTILYYGKKGN